MLFIKEMLSLLHIQLKGMERARIWLELNAIVAREMVILLAIGKKLLFIVRNQDTLSKNVPDVLKIVGQRLSKFDK